jgi:hypothetical protein
MHITIEVEVVTERCQHSQNDGSKEYYAFRVIGLETKWGSELSFRCSEAGYPGNAKMREWINSKSIMQETPAEDCVKQSLDN